MPSAPDATPTSVEESSTYMREAKEIQSLLQEYKEDSKNIQRQVNRLAELLEMSGLQASFNSHSSVMPASSMDSRTPVRPGLMMLESTPGLTDTRETRVASTPHFRNTGAKSFRKSSSHSSRIGTTNRAPRSAMKPVRRPPPPRPSPSVSKVYHSKLERGTELVDVHNVSVEAVMEEMHQFVVTPARERLLREAKIQQAMIEMKYEVGLNER